MVAPNSYYYSLIFRSFAIEVGGSLKRAYPKKWRGVDFVRLHHPIPERYEDLMGVSPFIRIFHYNNMHGKTLHQHRR
jgi:hypothetical protein